MYQPSRPDVTHREKSPTLPHKSTPTSPPRETGEKGKHNRDQDLEGRKHSKQRTQLSPRRAQGTAKSAGRTVFEETGAGNLPARDDQTSQGTTTPVPRPSSVTQCSRSWFSETLPDHQTGSAHVLVEALQSALKTQVLQALRILGVIAGEFRSYNLEIETIDKWTVEITGVDATLIPIVSNSVLQLLAPFESLNVILTKCVTAPGPMREHIIRDQAVQLLNYIHTYAEEYHLFQNQRLYLDIGRWIERLSSDTHNEQSNDGVLSEACE